MIITQSSERTATLADVTIHDAMRLGVITCRPEDGLPRIASIMVTRGIHATLLEPLTNRNPLIVTDLELIRTALEQPDSLRAWVRASEPVPMLPGDAHLNQAVATMAQQYVAHVLGTDPVSGEPCGILSSFDVVAALSGDQPASARIPRVESVRRSSSPRTLSATRAGDVMHPVVVTCPPDAPLRIIARSMAGHRVHCVAVAGVGEAGPHGQHFGWGLIDDMALVLAAHRGSLDEPAATIAATAPPAVNEGDSLERAARLMVSDGTRHVVVIGPTGLPSGMISTLDVACILATL